MAGPLIEALFMEKKYLPFLHQFVITTRIYQNTFDTNWPIQLNQASPIQARPRSGYYKRKLWCLQFSLRTIQCISVPLFIFMI